MAVSKKQQACVNRYVKENYDRINLTVPKGQKDRIQEHAKYHGESVNAFIFRAINETIENDKRRADKPVQAASVENQQLREKAEDFPKGFVLLSEQKFEAERQKRLAALQAMTEKK